MDYKDTLLLPTTDFAMRGNLGEQEPKRYAKWDEEKVYEKMKAKRQKAGASFNIHDGPPYANGHLHIGHALNKILKDIITKTHYFFGDSVRYTPGWDCHGLPIEQQVEVKLGDKKKTMSKSQIRQECRAWASEFVKIQKEEFKSLGVLGDWDEPYLTMKYKFEANIYRTLCEVAKKGLLIERSKPVFWSWAARSALAEAEVEYEDKEDYSLYVAFDLSKEACDKLGVGSAKAVIWTTTPWTLVANQAISLNPNEKYAVTKEGYIIALPLKETLINQGIIKGEIIKEFASIELEGLNAINPLNGRYSKFILGEHVLMDGGTGLVHTAPGHGEDDYFASLKYNIEVIMPVDEAGLYDETLRVKKLLPEELLGEFIGLHIFKANERLLDILGDAVVKVSKFVHSYPFCWRTHKPVIYRATKQWFISMDEPKLNGKTLRQTVLEALNQVKFYPEAGIKRISSMIENRPDWCISRQRDWGVPIAFFRDKTTKEVVFDPEILDNIASIFDEKGADAWWDLSIEELLPKGSNLNPANLEKVSDILDVWFDSGSTWNAVLNSGDYDGGGYQADMYLEGSDQHRGWFQSSLLLSCALNQKAPYKSILTHGFTVDGNGNKMSKSKGNVIAPADVAKKYGVEILRLWVGLSDYSSDLKISDEILKQVSEQYRKIRNTIRFLLANVGDLDDIYTNFGMLDKWILNRASKTFKEVSVCFRNYEFSKGFNILLNFLSTDLSGIYLDICKDRLYCDDKDSARRRSAQSAMAIIAKRVFALIAPTLTYSVDEAIEFAPQIIKKDFGDVFDIVYDDLDYEFDIDDNLLLASREKFNEIVDTLKKEKIIKSTLEVMLETSSNEILANDLDEVIDWYMVSFVKSIEDGETLATFEVGNEQFKVVKASRYKCPRCWKYDAKEENCLCPRCSKVLKNV
ncbi:isoleucyl-tRNA synthetase [Campylobacter hyointestinalis subsp. hyointestinalis LMG 9260]|uniref:isoleucine--tRNA ligase n=1 Tax=Campylobacter hyointestinalis TaxID=198 RepID=UPI0007C91721|nr:isoleucine--tRNA ligase [Campylobacter hyointestinalis]ANE32224.1 isoleucyl-tRNA synthetase [Campylobacter hyointestinalis subsp. hyointestinalis LMG 9260]